MQTRGTKRVAAALDADPSAGRASAKKLASATKKGSNDTQSSLGYGEKSDTVPLDMHCDKAVFRMAITVFL